MPWMMAILFSLSAQEPAAPAAAPEQPRWLSCDTVETSQGRVIVDRWAWVFFRPGSVSIDAPGAAQLDAFVAGYDAPSYCRVMVTAHADRVGSAARNLQLSRRRADVVVAYLRRKGFNVQLVIEPVGETQSLVDTPDNVAEAQNRYVQLWVDEVRSP